MPPLVALLSGTAKNKKTKEIILKYHWRNCTGGSFLSKGNEYLDQNNPDFQSTNASGQWLGSTLQSGGPDGSVVVCTR